MYMILNGKFRREKISNTNDGNSLRKREKESSHFPQIVQNSVAFEKLSLDKRRRQAIKYSCYIQIDL